MKNKLLIHFKIKLYIYVKGFLLFYKIIKKWERFIFHGNLIFSVSKNFSFWKSAVGFFLRWRWGYPRLNYWRFKLKRFAFEKRTLIILLTTNVKSQFAHASDCWWTSLVRNSKTERNGIWFKKRMAVFFRNGILQF